MLDDDHIVPIATVFNEDDFEDDSHVHVWLSDQCRLALTPPEPSPQPLTSSPAIRADSPLLGFSSAMHASSDPLHYPSPNYSRDLPILQLDTDKSLPALPTSYPRLSVYPQHSPTSSLSHSHSHSTSSTNSFNPTSLTRRPSIPQSQLRIPRQPSLPLLGNNNPIHSFPAPPLFGRNRTQSAASLHPHARLSATSSRSFRGSLSHLRPPSTSTQPLSPLPPKSTPVRRQSTRFPSISSTLSTPSVPNTSHATTPDPSLRHAVYIDSEEVSERLASLLRAQIPPSPSLSPSPDPTEVQHWNELSEDEDDEGQSLFYTVASGQSPHWAAPPPNTPMSSGLYAGHLQASSSQIFLGTLPETDDVELGPETLTTSNSMSTLSSQAQTDADEPVTPDTSPASSSAVPLESEDADEFPWAFSPATTNPRPPPPPPPPHAFSSGSRWSMGSSMVDLTSHAGKHPIHAHAYTGAHSASSSYLPSGPNRLPQSFFVLEKSLDDKDRIKAKSGKRSRLVSFISRLSHAPPAYGQEVPTVPGFWESVDVQGSPTSQQQPFRRKILSIDTSVTAGAPIPADVKPSSKPDIVPTPTSPSSISSFFSSSSSTTPAFANAASPSISPDSFPTTPASAPPFQSQVNQKRNALRSVVSLANPTASDAPPPSPGGKRRSRGIGFRGLVTKMGFGSSNIDEIHERHPSEVPLSEDSKRRRSLVATGTIGKPRRRLVISGVSEGDVRGLEAVKEWCESFGEVRQIARKPNGCLYVDFKKASVADTVCRVQAQVHIKGAGSVSLSWCNVKRGI